MLYEKACLCLINLICKQSGANKFSNNNCMAYAQCCCPAHRCCSAKPTYLTKGFHEVCYLASCRLYLKANKHLSKGNGQVSNISELASAFSGALACTAAGRGKADLTAFEKLCYVLSHSFGIVVEHAALAVHQHTASALRFCMQFLHSIDELRVCQMMQIATLAWHEIFLHNPCQYQELTSGQSQSSSWQSQPSSWQSQSSSWQSQSSSST